MKHQTTPGADLGVSHSINHGVDQILMLSALPLHDLKH